MRGMQSLIGVDIGGTTVKLGLIQCGEEFRVLKQAAIATQAADAAPVFASRIAAAVKAMVAEAGGPKISGVGVGSPGLIDPWQGIVRISPNLPNLGGFRLRDELATLLDWPVELQNDANAAVLGERWFSPASKEVKNMCLLTLGTGIGGGVICDGRLLVGADNAATELGHLKVEYVDPAPCGCGHKGCVEAYVGSGGIARIAGKVLASWASSKLRAENPTTKQIAEAADAGDAAAREVFRQVGHYLGRGIAHLIETFNPEKVVLAGGASAAIELLRPGIVAALVEYSSFEFTRNRCKIERSAFPDDINVIGAAAVYLDAHRQS